MATDTGKHVDFEQFTDKDGYQKGGVEIETTNPSETQEQEVQGQGNILKEKNRKAKWY
jgi:hypothetical protein